MARGAAGLADPPPNHLLGPTCLNPPSPPSCRPPSGFVQRKWVWPLLFFPLWGTLFITFGMGPILARTSDPLPIIQNCVAFAAAAATVAFAPGLAWHTGLRPWSDRDINQDNK